MCSYGYEATDEEVDGACPECGMTTVEGRASEGCCYSPVVCETCGWSPCDGSC